MMIEAPRSKRARTASFELVADLHFVNGWSHGKELDNGGKISKRGGTHAAGDEVIFNCSSAVAAGGGYDVNGIIKGEPLHVRKVGRAETVHAGNHFFRLRH